jgi:hypothetical protein
MPLMLPDQAWASVSRKFRYGKISIPPSAHRPCSEIEVGDITMRAYLLSMEFPYQRATSVKVVDASRCEHVVRENREWQYVKTCSFLSRSKKPNPSSRRSMRKSTRNSFPNADRTTSSRMMVNKSHSLATTQVTLHCSSLSSYR